MRAIKALEAKALLDAGAMLCFTDKGKAYIADKGELLPLRVKTAKALQNAI